MKRTLYLAAVALAILLMAPTMYGQTLLRLRFHVPFSFSVSNQTFTPGEYEFTQPSPYVLKVANQKSNNATFESVRPTESGKQRNGQVKLVFHCYGGRYFLATVSGGSWGSTYDFKTSPDETQSTRVNPRKPMTTVSIDPDGTVLIGARGQK